MLALAAGCASRGGAVPHPFPKPDVGSPAATPDMVPESAYAFTIIATALGLQGTPYRAGGETVDGFDCSGFTRYVFAQHGIALPRQASDQYQTGTEVKMDALQPGDLVFFTTAHRARGITRRRMDRQRSVRTRSERTGRGACRALELELLVRAVCRRETDH